MLGRFGYFRLSYGLLISTLNFFCVSPVYFSPELQFYIDPCKLYGIFDSFYLSTQIKCNLSCLRNKFLSNIVLCNIKTIIVTLMSKFLNKIKNEKAKNNIILI